MTTEFSITDTGYLTKTGFETSDASQIVSYIWNGNVLFQPKGVFNINLDVTANIDKTTTQSFNDNDPKSYLMASETQLMSIANESVSLTGVITSEYVNLYRFLPKTQGIKIFKGGLFDAIDINGCFGRVSKVTIKDNPSQNKNDYIMSMNLTLEEN